MLPNAFIGKPKRPMESELAGELDEVKPVWDQLVAALAEEWAASIQEWTSYSQRAGWSLRLKRKERKIVYLSPHRGSFTASFALGDRAVAAARKSGLPQQVLKFIDHAKRYAEGTAVRIEVKEAKDLVFIKKLAPVKAEN